MKNLRITIRLANEDRKKIDLLVKKGKIKSISHATRLALAQYIKDYEVKSVASK